MTEQAIHLREATVDDAHAVPSGRRFATSILPAER